MHIHIYVYRGMHAYIYAYYMSVCVFLIGFRRIRIGAYIFFMEMADSIQPAPFFSEKNLVHERSEWDP